MKLFKALWNTNYGEVVALIEANSLEEAKELIKPRAWEDVLVEEIILANTPNIVFINGGDY